MNSDELTIDVSGGGPTGMTFALAVLAYGVRARIRVFDPRWRRSGDHVVWRDLAHGNRRREQIVTMQSNVWRRLPPPVQRALFDRQDYSEVWPYGPDSPAHRGRPRNLPIRAIEDRLLELLQDAPGVTLVPERYEAARNDRPRLLAICEGAHAPTREYFIEEFGRPHPELYRLDGRLLEEVILGIQVEAHISNGETVLLTAAQNRYLLNTHRGRGFLNIRLTHEEAAELGSFTRANSVPIGELPCGARLQTAIGQGLRLFGIEQRRVLSIDAFRCSLVHRPRFVADLANGTLGCLLGDAANALHFWPGRGLNTGLKSALSLARCLARHWHGGPLRAADLCAHEGLMHMLQARGVGTRAWQAMVMCDESGSPRPIRERIARGMQGPCDRASLTREMLDRMRRIRARLHGRMDGLPDDRLLADRLAALDARTLKILVETGPWMTSEVGGPEVDVDALFPVPIERGHSKTSPGSTREQRRMPRTVTPHWLMSLVAA